MGRNKKRIKELSRVRDAVEKKPTPLIIFPKIMREGRVFSVGQGIYGKKPLLFVLSLVEKSKNSLKTINIFIIITGYYSTPFKIL